MDLGEVVVQMSSQWLIFHVVGHVSSFRLNTDESTPNDFQHPYMDMRASAGKDCMRSKLTFLNIPANSLRIDRSFQPTKHPLVFVRCKIVICTDYLDVVPGASVDIDCTVCAVVSFGDGDDFRLVEK